MYIVWMLHSLNVSDPNKPAISVAALTFERLRGHKVTLQGQFASDSDALSLLRYCHNLPH